MQYSMGEIPNYAYQVFKRGREENTDYYTLTNTSERSVAFFGNATYSYKGKYNLNGTLRYEGTNSLGKAALPAGSPPNVSGSWNAHEEEWFHNFNPTWSHLTLKASYSLTGDRPSVSNAYAIIKSKNPRAPLQVQTKAHSTYHLSPTANSHMKRNTSSTSVSQPVSSTTASM